MHLTDQQVKDFIYTFKLPIPAAKVAFLPYYVELLDPYYDVKKKLESYKNAPKDSQGLLKRNNLLPSLIETIKQKDEYLRFESAKEVVDPYTGEKFSLTEKIKYVQHLNMYQREHHKKSFISIDLKQANFQCLNYFKFDLFDQKETFEDFIAEHYKAQFLQESKILRQVLFGVLNPNRQKSLQKLMMNRIEKLIRSNGLIDEETRIYSMSTDEIYFETTNDKIELIAKIEKLLAENHFRVRVEYFQLFAPFVKEGYYKQYFDGSAKSFHLVPKDKLCQFIKNVEGGEMEELDLIFTDSNGVLLKHLEPYWIPRPLTRKELNILKYQKAKEEKKQ